MAFTPESFAVAVLKRLGAPVTPANLRAFTGWERAEGGHWNNSARFNPLNTTQPAPGAGNTGSQGNIKVYRSPQEGIDATVRTLKNGRYGNIIAAFLKGNDPHAVAQAIGSSPWGTSAALISKVIGGTPTPANVPTSGLGGSTTRTTTSTTGITPAADQARRSALAQFVLSGPNADPLRLATDYAKLGTQTQTTSRTQVTSSGSSPASRAPSGKGAVDFAGKPVAGWIAPILAYARQHGWKGSVTSGVRSYADQQRIYNSGVRPAARPGTSNHEFTAYPGGAVDVTDAAQLSAILRSSPYASKLVWAGAKDLPHFSHPHGGSY